MNQQEYNEIYGLYDHVSDLELELITEIDSALQDIIRDAKELKLCDIVLGGDKKVESLMCSEGLGVVVNFADGTQRGIRALDYSESMRILSAVAVDLGLTPGRWHKYLKSTNE